MDKFIVCLGSGSLLLSSLHQGGLALTRPMRQQALAARYQQPFVDGAVAVSLGGVVQGSVELVVIVGDENQVGAGVQAGSGDPADAVAIHRAHIEIVGQHQALVIPLLADRALDHRART